jgi:hypothetical protein
MTVEKKKMTRSYPPFWERFVPIILAILGLIIVVMLIVAVTVAIGIFPGAG